MRRRQPPRLWLMTDERMGGALWPALARLPRGSGVVFRHRATPVEDRRALFERVRAITRARGLVLVLAGSMAQAVAWRADGVHGRGPGHAARPLLRTAPAHDARELAAAKRAGAEVVFLSPVFPTRSHRGGRTLGPARFGLLARRVRGPKVIALGGMDGAGFRRMRSLGACGWAAIDAWMKSAQPASDPFGLSLSKARPSLSRAEERQCFDRLSTNGRSVAGRDAPLRT